LLATAACGGGSGAAPSTSRSADTAGSASDVTATGGFGEKPTLTIPTTAAPSTLESRVLAEGDGPAVAKGQTLVADYLGQTWSPKNGTPNVFDNSYDRNSPIGFVIGGGTVIKGWDQALVGQQVGSRVLLAIPPDLAYGAQPDPSNELSGQALVFVVDIRDALAPDVSATGTAVQGELPAGLPAVTSTSGVKPEITSVKSISGKKAVSGLLLAGAGEPIDETKTLALQIVQTDAATGKQDQETWGTGVQVVPAAQVLPLVSALKGAKVGSRAVAVSPEQEGGAGRVAIVIDVVGQY
jgi:peptidylprolyl isomerase